MELHPLLHLGVVAIEKGAFGSPLTEVANFTLFLVIEVLQFCFWVMSFNAVEIG